MNTRRYIQGNGFVMILNLSLAADMFMFRRHRDRELSLIDRKLKKN